MKNLKDIFQNIKETFCSLWQFKERGKTLEIITPYTTITSKFISIFITERDNEIIVTDGGWICSGNYDVDVDIEADYFTKLFFTYESYFEIKRTSQNEIPIFYKKTNNDISIPSLVFDVAQFIQAIVGGSIVEFENPEEKEEKETFKKEANNFISNIIPKDNYKINSPLSDDLKSVRFNIIVTNRNRLALLNYVTGSNVGYFIGSIGKANLNFEIASQSEYNNVVDKKVAFINDLALGFKEDRLYKYLETMQKNTDTINIKWSEKHKLKELLLF